MEKYLSTGCRLEFDEITGVFEIQDLLGVGNSCAVYYADYLDKYGNSSKCVLKEYNPRKIEVFRSDDYWIDTDDEEFDNGIARFEEGIKKQFQIRQLYELTNSTISIQGVYRHYGTIYIVMPCFAGSNYSNLQEKDLNALFRRMKALGRTIDEYHRKGFLHLDLKPENIWTVPETVELLMLFDFDSVTKKDFIHECDYISSTREWASPEQLDRTKWNTICEASDIYSIVEITFYKITGHHSSSSDLEDNFLNIVDELQKKNSTLNPAVWEKLRLFFVNGLAREVDKRIPAAPELIVLLDELINLSDVKSIYIVTSMPEPNSFFVGRDREIEELHSILSTENTVILYGMGGIGKSEIVKNYWKISRHDFDACIFIPKTRSLKELFIDDSLVTLKNLPRVQEDETEDQYFLRKLTEFKTVCNERVLLIIDNYDQIIPEENEDLNKILTLPCKKIITSRLSNWDYKHIEIKSLSQSEDQLKLFCHWAPEAKADIDNTERIINAFQGYTLSLEVLSKSMHATFSTPKEIWQHMRSGVADYSSKIHTNKDNTPLSETGRDLFDRVFQISNLSHEEKLVLLYLSMFGINRVYAPWLIKLCGEKNAEYINMLIEKGWISRHPDSTVQLHQVIVDCIKNNAVMDVDNANHFIGRLNTYIYEDFCNDTDSVHFRTIERSLEAVRDYLENSALELDEYLYRLDKSLKIPGDKETITSICDQRISALWGNSIPTAIRNRYAEELSYFAKKNYLSTLLLHYLLCVEIRKMGYISMARGNIGHSFIAWLLGLSWVNPMEMGLDYRIISNLRPSLELNIPPECNSRLMDYINHLEFAGDIKCYNPHEEVTIAVICERNSCIERLVNFKTWSGYSLGFYPVIFTRIMLFQDASLSVVNAHKCFIPQDWDHEIPHCEEFFLWINNHLLDARKKMIDEVYYSLHDYESDKEVIDKVFEVFPRRTFNDCLKMLGVIYGTEVFFNNQDKLLSEGIMKWDELLVFSNDILNCLMKMGMREEDALILTDSIRKGRYLKDARVKEIVDKCDIPQMYNDIFSRIHYVSPKSHCINQVIGDYNKFLCRNLLEAGFCMN